jgi:C4-dicarboxylate transporter
MFPTSMYKSSGCGNPIGNDITNVVDNRGEDLRFPISSSSGFSSPMKGNCESSSRQN